MKSKSVSFQIHKGTFLIKRWSMDWNILHRKKYQTAQPVNTIQAELQVPFLLQGWCSQVFESYICGLVLSTWKIPGFCLLSPVCSLGTCWTCLLQQENKLFICELCVCCSERNLHAETVWEQIFSEEVKYLYLSVEAILDLSLGDKAAL